MRQMQRVLWTKGVLLSPQHLQTQDRFLEDLIGFQLTSLSFCPWGFSQLEIDQEALTGGTLLISRAAGIFPDGMPFEIPQSDSAPAPKPILEHMRVDQEWLDLYLGIPEHRSGAGNISVVPGDRSARYVSEVAMRRDENTGLAEKPIQLARKNLRILAETESLDGHSVLHLARVRRSAAGQFQLDPTFIPPVVNIAASPYLVSIARRLVELLSAKSTALSGTRRHRNQGLADFGVSDVANFWLLYTVNTHLPGFRHLVEAGGAHPRDLYQAIIALAGALTTFSITDHPRALPAYSHTDLAGCFGPLDETVRRLLETVVPATFVTLPLRETMPTIHATAIEQDRYLAAPQLFLAIRVEAGGEEAVRRIPQLLKVGSADQVERLIKQALPGVALRYVPSPPSSVPARLGYHYFQLERSGAEWDSVRFARNLAVYVPSEIPQPQLELVVLLPRDQG
jgi:type VI secretion system protein ImpJ